MNRIFLLILLALPLGLWAQKTNLAGFVTSESGTLVNNVTVSLFNDQGALIGSTITIHGRYAFEGLAANREYRIQLEKSGSPLNGLSTFDHVMIARHILAVETFEKPSDYLVADVDGSGSVSISDMIYLRSLILGISEELPQKRNWLFLAEDQPAAGTPAYNTFTYYLTGNSVLKNFTILKIGDLNKNALLE